MLSLVGHIKFHGLSFVRIPLVFTSSGDMLGNCYSDLKTFIVGDLFLSRSVGTHQYLLDAGKHRQYITFIRKVGCIIYSYPVTQQVNPISNASKLNSRPTWFEFPPVHHLS
jgi:hypothetical protein